MANFQNRVCRRSMQAVVDSIDHMNADIIEARTMSSFDFAGRCYEGASVSDAVSLMLLHQATELGRAIQRVLDGSPNVPDPSEEDDFDAACEWRTYNEDCSS